MKGIKKYMTAIPPYLLLIMFCSEGFAAVTFKIRSQNFLHLGWGTPGVGVQANKCTALGEMMQTNDVIIIQELMQYTDPCTTQTTTYNFQFIVNPSVPPGLGSSSYKEYYGFYIKTAKVNATGDTYIAGGKFERPPYAIGLKINDGTNYAYIWVGNIHSIFGNSVKLRYAEAKAAKNFYIFLKNKKLAGATSATTPVIIGGDWNIPVKNKSGNYTEGFDWLPTNNAEGVPNTPTSLSVKGIRASAYDHFIYSKDLTVNNVKSETSASFPSDLLWRQNVTDHLGISAEVTIP